MRSGIVIIAACLICLTYIDSAMARSVFIINSINCCSYGASMRGFDEALDAEMIRFCLAESNDHDALLALMRQSKPDMVAAVGSTAAHFAVAHVTDIPIIYFMVMNPDRELLQADNAYGVVLNQDPALLLHVLRDMHIGARRIGTLISPGMQQRFAFRQLQQAVHDSDLTLQSVVVDRKIERSAAIRHLLEHSDAIVLLPDRQAITPTTLRQLVNQSRQLRVPLLVPTGLFVKLGALAAFTFDPPDIGRQAAAMANAILDGESVRRFEFPRHKQLVLNRTTVKWNRLRLPRSLTLGARHYD